MNLTYKHTIISCFVGYIVQAIVNNFAPLLFLTFQAQYGIPLSKITLLITINFVVQLLVDLLAAKYVDRIGYRVSIVAAHILVALGLLLLPILPEVLPPFSGILIAVVLYAIGGGLLEVLVSPIMESCPTDNKSAAMSLLHSFFCWGHVGVVLISTVFFAVFGTQNWKYLSFLLALIPAVNAFAFSRTPIASLMEDGERGMTILELIKSKIFWLLVVMMVCAGASEQAVSQWASAFAEQGLGVTKTVGDLAGPMSFAVLMGLSRTIYGKLGEKLDLNRFMLFSILLCIVSYLLISLSSNPVISLLGCALTGFSVGILWPGSFSKASAILRRGGTALFALLALAGDLGCSAGPTLVGFVSDCAGGDMKTGILCAIIFPILMLVAIPMLLRSAKNHP